MVATIHCNSKITTVARYGEDIKHGLACEHG
jgi:hypothetical protein